MDEQHDAYLVQVEILTGIGSEVDDKEVEVSNQKQRKKCKQYREAPEKRQGGHMQKQQELIFPVDQGQGKKRRKKKRERKIKRENLANC